MILGLAVGWSVEAFAGVKGATLLGALFGIFAANLVPLGPGCSTPER